MVLYNFYIFGRTGRCLLYKEFSRPQNTMMDDAEEEQKLVFGMLYSLKDLAAKLSPAEREGGDGLHVLRTNTFTLHHFQSQTGLVFVLNTDNDVPDQYHTHKLIYTTLFIDYVARNPLHRRDSVDDPIDSPVFEQKLEELLQQRARPA